MQWFRPPLFHWTRQRFARGLISAASVASLMVGLPATTTSAANPDFNQPHDWLAHSQPGAAEAGKDPLNVIISANSDITMPYTFQSFMGVFGWQPVGIGTDVRNGNCISPESAGVQNDSSFATQQVSWRPYGCVNVGTPGNPGGITHNHLRGWRQNATGSWFLALSEEHVCTVGLTPWHCIDPTGFDQGREDFKQQIIQSARARGYQLTGNGGTTCPTVVTGPGCLNLHYVNRTGGTGSDGVSYDGLVLVVTLKLPPLPPTSYSATTGPNCTQSSSQGVIVTTPDHTWYPTSEGGLVGSGCNGNYVWTHSNGNTASGDSVKWWFHTGLASSATCDVQVYIPATRSIVSTAHPAYYAMYDNNGNTHVGGFIIDQKNVNGWQDMGRWPAAGGTIAVVVDDRGPYGYGVAADAVRVNCSS